MSAPALSVVIPAYDEAGRLSPTLARLTAYLASRPTASELIVVDDGSRDATAAIAETAGARVIRLPRNRGKGAAVRAGALAARGAVVLLCDADLATPIEEVERLEAALAAGADLAIGSRRAQAGSIEARQPLARRVMGAGFRVLVRATTGVRARDPMCGFKALTRAAAHDLFARTEIDRWAWDIELLALAGDRWRVVEVPVRWRHVDGSRVALGRATLGALRDLARIRDSRRG